MGRPEEGVSRSAAGSRGLVCRGSPVGFSRVLIQRPSGPALPAGEPGRVSRAASAPGVRGRRGGRQQVLSFSSQGN